MIRQVLFIAAVAAALGSAAGAEPIVISDQASQDIYEAAFRHLFGNTANSFLVRCLVVPGPKGGAQSAEPTPEFLARFADIKPPVKGGSGCGKAADGIGVADKETGNLAMYFSVGPADCTSESECTLEAGYFGAPTAAASWTYHLKKSNGKWSVVSEELKWIS